VTGRVLAFPEMVFGVCPVCRQSGELRNVGREHWAICVRHRLKWHVGSNMFSAWRDEAPALWAKNDAVLSGYREVQS
jgi:thermostable 8-oxoguanine DNA glycosylase